MDATRPDARILVPPPGLADEARRRGMQVAAVMLYEPNAEPAAPESLHFFTITPSLPAAGDHLVTENNRVCQVVRTLFGISKVPLPEGGTARMLIPHIIAILVPEAAASDEGEGGRGS